MPPTRPVGDTALLIELHGLADVLAWTAALRAAAVPGVLDVVPGASTVLVRWDARRADAAGVAEVVAETRPAPAPARAHGGVVEVPVRYDGADLEEVAQHCGLSPDDVAVAHRGTEWVVAFCGFSPGFGYLAGGDPRLAVPRRVDPRTRVPAGSVALAGGYSAVYPRQSPGGWQLIGRTDLPVWSLDREPPALLRPGTRVRFVAAG